MTAIEWTDETWNPERKELTVDTIYRQGDVLLQRVDESPTGRMVRRSKDGRVILAYGEVTGHAHAIRADRDEVVLRETAGGDRFLQVLADAGVVLEHAEHATITVPPGDYAVTRQREYTPERVVRVAD